MECAKRVHIFVVVVAVLAARSIPYCHFGPNRIDLFGGQRSNADDGGAVLLQYDVDVDAYKKKTSDSH